MLPHKHYYVCSKQRSFFPSDNDFTELNPNFANDIDSDANIGASLVPRMQILELLARDIPLLHNLYTSVRRACLNHREEDVPITGEWLFTGLATFLDENDNTIPLISGNGIKMRINRTTRNLEEVEEEFLIGYVGDGLMKVFTSADLSDYVGPVPDFIGTPEQTIDYLNGFYKDVVIQS